MTFLEERKEKKRERERSKLKRGRGRNRVRERSRERERERTGKQLKSYRVRAKQGQLVLTSVVRVILAISSQVSRKQLINKK